MSMNFEKPISEEEQGFIKEMLGDQVKAIDAKTALLEGRVIQQQQMKKIANKLNQPVYVELHGEDEIKTMSDGSQYRVTMSGWVRIR